MVAPVENRQLNYRADIVIPCFNEEAALPVTLPKILSYLKTLIGSPENRLSSFRVILVDDGSKDKTWEIISQFSQTPQVDGLKLSRNYGHQAAMLAGLSHANADVVITMDADLQDDITAIDRMVLAYENGAHLALGVRIDRTTDSHWKRSSANLYYRLLSLLGVNIIENHADFRLMSKVALAALLDHQEVNLFLRGLIPTLGFTVTLVPYTRKAREQGETKYTLRKMLRLAIDGVTSFSVTPLRMISVAGAILFLGSAITAIAVFFQWLLFPGTVVPGWTSTVLPLLVLGGIQILATGVLGEYIGKIYLEVKRRPRFIVERETKGS